MYKLQLNKNPFTNKIKDSESVIRTNDGAVIPFDPANTDYQAYLAWCAEGNLPRPADFVEPSSESSVTPLPAEGTE
jgi:hypothetical protein